MSSFVDEEALDAAEAAAVDAEQREPEPEHDDEPSVELAVPEHGDEPLLPEHMPSDALAIVPPEQEMRALVQLAVTLSAADLVPGALRNKPNDVLLVLLTARDLGVKLTTALRLCHPIDGQVTVAPKLKLAIIRERKLGRVWPDPANDENEATWYAVRADDPETTFASTFTMVDAERAKLNGKQNWRTYPARMLSWRALGYLMDDAFGEVGSGLYSPDELGAVTDEDGAVILDVTEVGPLDGTRAPKGRASRAAGPDPLAPQEDRDRIERRLRALPDAGLEAAKALWAQSVGVKVAELTAKRVAVAEALLDSLWKRAEGGEWGEWERPADEGRSEPAGAPESDPGGAEPSESPEALRGAQRGRSGDAELPDLADVDAVIDWTGGLPLSEVDQRLLRLGVEPERDDENGHRHALAVRVATDLGLL